MKKILTTIAILVLLSGCINNQPINNILKNTPPAYDTYVPWWVDNVSTQYIINYKF